MNSRTANDVRHPSTYMLFSIVAGVQHGTSIAGCLNLTPRLLHVQVFPMTTSADMYLNGDLMAEGVVVRVVRYQKHKREGHYNYWITGHQKLVRSCNDLRVLCVEFLTEGRFKICFVAPQ
jgi:hypothetical protein